LILLVFPDTPGVSLISEKPDGKGDMKELSKGKSRGKATHLGWVS
jgi:hypothetical protein